MNELIGAAGCHNFVRFFSFFMTLFIVLSYIFSRDSRISFVYILRQQECVK